MGLLYGYKNDRGEHWKMELVVITKPEGVASPRDSTDHINWRVLLTGTGTYLPCYLLGNSQLVYTVRSLVWHQCSAEIQLLSNGVIKIVATIPPTLDEIRNHRKFPPSLHQAVTIYTSPGWRERGTVWVSKCLAQEHNKSKHEFIVFLANDNKRKLEYIFIFFNLTV